MLLFKAVCRSREFLLRSDTLPHLVGHLSSKDESVAEMAAEIISELCTDRRCRDELLRCYNCLYSTP